MLRRCKFNPAERPSAIGASQVIVEHDLRHLQHQRDEEAALREGLELELQSLRFSSPNQSMTATGTMAPPAGLTQGLSA